MQAAIYCTLKNKGQTAYTVNEKLIDGKAIYYPRAVVYKLGD